MTDLHDGWLELVEAIELSADPRAVWRLASDFTGLARWMPGVSAVKASGRRPGATREVRMGNAVMQETLLALDDATMQFTYRLDRGPLRAFSYTSTLTVAAAGSGTRLEWRARCKPDGAPGRLEETLRRAYRAGLLGMASAVMSGEAFSVEGRSG